MRGGFAPSRYALPLKMRKVSFTVMLLLGGGG
jgi:hypothetical protein